MRLLLLGGTGQVGARVPVRSTFPKGIDVVAPARADRDLDRSRGDRRADRAPTLGCASSMPPPTPMSTAPRASKPSPSPSMPRRPRISPPKPSAAAFRSSTSRPTTSSTARKGAPYVEDDATAPLNVYGAASSPASARSRAGNPRHVILRTSWVYSPHGKNFVKTILRLAAERDRLTVVDDQRGCPTAARDIARGLPRHRRCAAPRSRSERPTASIISPAAARRPGSSSPAQSSSWQPTGLRRSPQIVPIRTVDYPTPAVRPADTRLDCTAIGRAFGITPRPWREALAETPSISLLTEQRTSHEGHHSRRRLGHAALSRDARHQQAAAAGLRQADDLLPAVDADAGRHPRHPADLDAASICRSTSSCSATAPPGASGSLTSSRTSRSASPMPSSSAATSSAAIASRSSSATTCSTATA